MKYCLTNFKIFTIIHAIPSKNLPLFPPKLPFNLHLSTNKVSYQKNKSLRLLTLYIIHYMCTFIRTNIRNFFHFCLTRKRKIDQSADEERKLSIFTFCDHYLGDILPVCCGTKVRERTDIFLYKAVDPITSSRLFFLTIIILVPFLTKKM